MQIMTFLLSALRLKKWQTVMKETQRGDVDLDCGFKCG